MDRARSHSSTSKKAGISLISKLFAHSFLRYCFVGGMTTASSYIIFFALYRIFSINHIIASGIGYVIGVIFAYILNRIFTFKYQGSISASAVRFIIVYAVNLCVGMGLMYVLADIIGQDPVIANLFVTAYYVIANYTGMRLWAFSKSQKNTE